MISRIILILCALSFAAYGIYVGIMPEMLTTLLKIPTPHSAELMSEIYAVYAGVQTVAGLALLWIGFRGSYQKVIKACGWAAIFFLGLVGPRIYHAYTSNIITSLDVNQLMASVQQSYIHQAIAFESILFIVLGLIWIINRSSTSHY